MNGKEINVLKHGRNMLEKNKLCHIIVEYKKEKYQYRNDSRQPDLFK